jgi:hypothetical protein
MKWTDWALPSISIVLVAWWSAPAPSQSPPPKPSPPPLEAPALDSRTATLLCVGCDQPFDFDGHREAMQAVLGNPHVAELRRAMYFQDSVHQFESKAHFDNCDFDGAAAYLAELEKETETHVAAAVRAGDSPARASAIRKAFFAVGQALHGVQDFYAHSNYVEMQAAMAKRVTDIEVVRPWRPSGRARLGELRTRGLVSGFVWWGLPQRCPDKTAWHSELAKDSEKTVSGKERVSHLENISRYRIAVFLAREASKDYLEDAFKRWPLLREVNGPHVAFEVVIDRRGL